MTVDSGFNMASLFNNLELLAAADFHVHLRDGPMMQAVTPTIRQGGVDTVFVMVRHTHTPRNPFTDYVLSRI